MPPDAERADSRQSTVLDAALGVFSRYGYRKTSMDEVAHAAGISRQGLYLQFANKEELFRRTLEHSLNGQLAAATAALSRAEEGLEPRLVAACDAWCGRFVGSLGSDAADLMCASTALAGTTLADYDARFESALAAAIADSPPNQVCTRAGLGAAQVAAVLHAAARGFKQSCTSREQFIQSMTVAARMCCAPLHRR
jgi:AcrR family transcriptional regulator